MIDYNFFEAIVAGEKPENMMAIYDNKITVEPYVVYKKEDAEIIKCNYISLWQQYLDSKALSTSDEARAEELVHQTLLTPAEGFFDEFTDEYDHDDDGNAISDKNPNGKWSTYQGGGRFSVPFLLLDGREVFQARKGDVDWDRMHLYGKEIYERAWEMVVEGSKPKNDYEQNIYDNMKNRKAYFGEFANKEVYVMHNVAFWAYAFVSNETGWVELEEHINQFDWEADFYERFIDPLPDDTLLTIYECKK